MFSDKRDIGRLTSLAARRDEAAPESASRGRRIPLKHYVLWSTAVSSAALIVAIAVSIGSLVYADENTEPERLAEVSGATEMQMSSTFVESMNSRHEAPP